jgi:hypothetical protein
VLLGRVSTAGDPGPGAIPPFESIDIDLGYIFGETQ